MQSLTNALITTLLLSFVPQIGAQQTEFYNVASALNEAESVESLVLNLNDTSVCPDLTGVGQLHNLRELVVFPVEDFVHGRYAVEKADGSGYEILGASYDVQVTSLPSEIGQCTKLRVLSINHGALISLPSEMEKLIRLEELEISGAKIDEGQLITLLRTYQHLQYLNIYDCGISSEGLDKIKAMLPECEVLATVNDLYDVVNLRRQTGDRPTVFVERKRGHSLAGIGMRSQHLAAQFLNSLPDSMISRYNMRYSPN